MESNRHNALKKRTGISGVTLREHCQDQYRKIVDGQSAPVVLRSRALSAAQSRTLITCADCGSQVRPCAMRQVLRGDNPRARVCVKCANKAA